jgi:hypothetical protein
LEQKKEEFRTWQNSLALSSQKGQLKRFKSILNSILMLYGQMDDEVALSSLLSPVDADLFMGDFKEETLTRATHRHLCWFQYVDNTFVIWPRGLERLVDFLLPSATFTTISTSPWRERAAFPEYWWTGDQMAPWGIDYTGSPPTNSRYHHHLARK